VGDNNVTQYTYFKVVHMKPSNIHSMYVSPVAGGKLGPHSIAVPIHEVLGGSAPACQVCTRGDGAMWCTSSA